MPNKTYAEAQDISHAFVNDYLYTSNIDDIIKVEISKISACDSVVVFPPLTGDETTDYLCLLVHMNGFSPKTASLPSMYQGMRVYYKKRIAPQFKSFNEFMNATPATFAIADAVTIT